MTTHETPAAGCPHCGYHFEAASDITPAPPRRPPKEGDISICINCGEISIFNKDLSLRLPTRQEKAEAVELSNLIQAQIFIKGRGLIPGKEIEPEDLHAGKDWEI